MRPAVALVVITLATAACASGHHTSKPRPPTHSTEAIVSGTTVSSSRLVKGGRIRCAATVSGSVKAGSPLGLRFVLRNVSSRPAKMSLGGEGQWLVIRAADGTTYDTRVPLRNEVGPLMGLATIAPGTTKTVPWIGKYLPVRWQGPLLVTPGCGQTTGAHGRPGSTRCGGSGGGWGGTSVVVEFISVCPA